jgi:hypothetical protein
MGMARLQQFRTIDLRLEKPRPRDGPRLLLSNVSRLVVRSISTAYPQQQFSECVSVDMGLLRNRSQGAKKPAGLSRRAQSLSRYEFSISAINKAYLTAG